jgi:oligogalacturonide lyase
MGGCWSASTTTSAPMYTAGLRGCDLPANIEVMRGVAERISRRVFLASGMAAVGLAAEGTKGASFPSVSKRFEDAATELEVYRLTDPAYANSLPPYYCRSIARNSSWMLFCSEREGAPQAFRMELKTGATKQLTEATDLDGSTLTLTPDNRSFCYFAGRSLYLSNLTTLKERELYKIPDGWERCEGLTVGPDGTHATFAERQGDGSRLRMVALVQGGARTVISAPFVMSTPIHRPMRAQILYRQGDEALWLTNSDGQQNHQLKLGAGKVGPANWSPDGKTILYLNLPEDRTQLNTIREEVPDTNTDKLVAKTSQFVTFGFNRDTSVFVGASRNAGSPTVLILLRVTKRELTLCEHKASHPEMVNPMFTPDSQRLYFQSDREGKSTIYCMHVEKLIEKTEAETG